MRKTLPAVLPVVLVLLVAGFLRFYQLGHESLWLDEGYSVSTMHRSVFSIPLEASRGNQGPLYFVILNFWTTLFGTSELALRMPSAIFGIISVLLTYRLGAALFDRRTAIIAAFLSAVSLFQIFYSQEARPYSLLLLFSLLSFLSFVEVLQHNSRKWYVLLFLSNVCVAYTHAFGLATIGIQLLFLILFWGKYKSQMRRMLLTEAAVIMAVSPLFLLLHNEAMHIMERGFWVPEPSLSTVYYTFLDLAGGIFTWRFLLVCVALAPLLIERKGGTWIWRRPLESLGSMSWSVRFEALNKALLLLLWLLLPILAAFAVSKITTPIYVNRYLIGSSPALLLLVARGMSNLVNLGSRKTTWLLLVLVLTAIAFLAIPRLETYYRSDTKEQWRGAAEFIVVNSEEGDAIVLDSWECRFPFGYYYEGGLPVFAPSSLDEAISGTDRLWLVISHTGNPGDHSAVEAHLIERCGADSLVYQQQLTGVRLVLFRLNGEGNVKQ